jgi:endonuclease/exonuclease/phosphatase family metal-dependent hydrolase
LTDFIALTWNIFHGRDAPPDDALFTLRSRLLRTTEDNGVYVQVNRLLLDEYASLIAHAQWSVCLLQETPPSWMRALAERTGAEPCRTLTSRNQVGVVRAAIARHNPDLLGALEGGSNLTLVRPPWRLVDGSCRSLLLNPFPERGLNERRRMSFARMRLDGHEAEVCVANLHASTGPPEQTEREARRAARVAVEWAGGRPLVLGGDFNARPSSSPALFDDLAREFELTGRTAPDAIDHLLARRLNMVDPALAWPAERRELEVTEGAGKHGLRLAGKRRLRLSDHAPVEARFRLPPLGESGPRRGAITTVDG